MNEPGGETGDQVDIGSERQESVSRARARRDRPASWRVVLLRLTFAAAILLLPAQLIYQRAFSQPYPAVFQPSFASTPLIGDILTAQVPIVRVLFADGHSTEIPFEDVLPEARLLDKSVFKSAFFTEARATDPETVRWLSQRLNERFPERLPVQMIVDWSYQAIDVTGAEPTTSEISKSIVIDLEQG